MMCLPRFLIMSVLCQGLHGRSHEEDFKNVLSVARGALVCSVLKNKECENWEHDVQWTKICRQHEEKLHDSDSNADVSARHSLSSTCSWNHHTQTGIRLSFGMFILGFNNRIYYQKRAGGEFKNMKYLGLCSIEELQIHCETSQVFFLTHGRRLFTSFLNETDVRSFMECNHIVGFSVVKMEKSVIFARQKGRLTFYMKPITETQFKKDLGEVKLLFTSNEKLPWMRSSVGISQMGRRVYWWINKNYLGHLCYFDILRKEKHCPMKLPATHKKLVILPLFSRQECPECVTMAGVINNKVVVVHDGGGGIFVKHQGLKQSLNCRIVDLTVSDTDLIVQCERKKDAFDIFKIHLNNTGRRLPAHRVNVDVRVKLLITVI